MTDPAGEHGHGRRALVVAVGRPTFDLDAAEAEVAAAVAVLEHSDLSLDIVDEMVTTPDAIVPVVQRVAEGDHDLVVVLQGTFADANAVIAIGDATASPIVVWSFPEDRTGGRLRLNSLCGANLAAFSLRRRDHRAGFLYVDPRRQDAAARLDRACRDASGLPSGRDIDEPLSVPLTPQGARVEQLVAEARIGVIGERPDGFEPCDVDAELVRNTMGATVVRLPLDDLFTAADDATPVAVQTIRDRAMTELTIEPEVASAGLAESARLGAGLDAIVEQHVCSAIATRCWPECMVDYGGAVCAPQAMLCDDGVPAVCEADGLGALTALMLQHVSGDVPFVADLVDARPDDDTSVVWHCGVAPASLAADDEPPAGIVHPNRHRALLNQFALRPGRVTVARIGRGPDGLRLVVGGGTMLDRDRPFVGTCGTLRWDVPVGDVLRTVFDCGLEHHFGVVYGDHGDVLVELAARWSIPVVRLGHRGEERPARPLASSAVSM